MPSESGQLRAEDMAARTLSGLAWTFASASAQAVLQLATLAVLARLLEPRDFGVLAAALVFVGLSTTFSQLGVGPAIVQRPDLRVAHLRVGLTLSVTLGLAVAGATWAVSPLIASAFRMPELVGVLRVLAWLFPLAALSVVSEALLQRELRFRDLALADVIASAVGYSAVAMALAYRGFGVWALVAGSLTQAALRSALLRARRPHPSTPSWNPHAARQLLHFGGGFTLARIANYLAGQADNFVVGARLGPQALGLYGRAYQLMTAPATIFGQVLDKVLFPGMARLQGERDRLAPVYRRGVALVALCVLPVSAGVVVLAPEIVAVILGPRWQDVVVPLQVLALGTLFRTSYKISDSLARATGAVYSRAWRQVLYAVAVGGGAWAGSVWGLPGVAAGVLGAIALNFLLMAHLSLRLTGLRWTEFAAAHLPGLAVAGVVVATVWPVAALLRGWQAPAAATAAVASLTALGGAGLLVRCVPGLILGPDPRWMWQELSEFLAHRRRSFRPVHAGDGAPVSRSDPSAAAQYTAVRPVRIEFLGLPGAGKSVLAVELAAVLDERGIPVRLVGAPAAGMFRRLGVFVLAAARRPRYAAASARRIAASGQRSTGALLKVLHNWLAVSGRLFEMPAPRAVQVLDQGLFQALWSIGYSARRDVPDVFYELLRNAPLPDVVVVVDASVDTVAHRLRARGTGRSRMESDRASVGSSLSRGARVLDAVRAVLNRCPPGQIEVLTVVNEARASLPEAAAGLADRISPLAENRSVPARSESLVAGVNG